MNKYILPVIGAAIFLTGCQQLQQTLNDASAQVNKLTSKSSSASATTSNDDALLNGTATTTTLSQICSDFSKNSFRAKERWENKAVQITDVITNINESRPLVNGDPRFVKQATLSFRTKYEATANLGGCNANAFIDYSELTKYSVGQRVTLKGVVRMGMGDSSVTSVIVLSPAKVISAH